MLSELKTRYLYASMAELRSKNRTRTPAPEPNTTGTAGTTPAEATTGTTGKARASGTAGAAEPIIREALVDAQTVALRGPRPAWKGWRVRHLAAIGIAMAGALLVFGMGRTLLWGGDHARFSRDQLDRVSPYLSRGARSENGRGPAFVARIGDGWSALQASKRTLRGGGSRRNVAEERCARRHDLRRRWTPAHPGARRTVTSTAARSRARTLIRDSNPTHAVQTPAPSRLPADLGKSAR